MPLTSVSPSWRWCCWRERREVGWGWIKVDFFALIDKPFCRWSPPWAVLVITLTALLFTYRMWVPVKWMLKMAFLAAKYSCSLIPTGFPRWPYKMSLFSLPLVSFFWPSLHLSSHLSTNSPSKPSVNCSKHCLQNSLFLYSYYICLSQSRCLFEHFQNLGWLPPNYKPRTLEDLAVVEQYWQRHIIPSLSWWTRGHFNKTNSLQILCTFKQGLCWISTLRR